MIDSPPQPLDVTEVLPISKYPAWDSLLPKLNQAGDWAKQLSLWYESGWQLAIEGGRRPIANQVLQSLDETQRSILTPVFESIDSHYDSIARQRSQQTNHAGDRSPAIPSQGTSQQTRDVAEDATVELPVTRAVNPVIHSGHGKPPAIKSGASDTAWIHGDRTPVGSANPVEAESVNLENPQTMEFSAGDVLESRSSGKGKVHSKTAPTESSPGLPQIPGYRIDAILGRGGMGVVYLARQLGIDRPVALKMVLSGVHTSRTLLDRFLIEAKAVGKLRHENIVQIYDSGFAWLDAETQDSLVESGNYVMAVEKRQGLKIGCPEEIAFRQGWITSADLNRLASQMNNEYGTYLKSIIDWGPTTP